MALRDPIAVYNAGSNNEAFLVCQALEGCGIEAHVTEDLSPVGGSLFGLIPEIHKPQVWVERADIDRAKPVLDEFERRKDQLRNFKDQVASYQGHRIQVTCDECGENLDFPVIQRGSVQECSHCGAYVDVEDETSPFGSP